LHAKRAGWRRSKLSKAPGHLLSGCTLCLSDPFVSSETARDDAPSPKVHLRSNACLAQSEKASTQPVRHCPTAMYNHYGSIVVTAKPARPLDFLGRAERSSSIAAPRRTEGAELDGESADRGIIKVTAMSDTVRETLQLIRPHIRRSPARITSNEGGPHPPTRRV
jgi:hypothetical protein